MVRVEGLKFDFHTNAEKLTGILGEFKKTKIPPAKKLLARKPPEIPKIPEIMPVPRCLLYKLISSSKRSAYQCSIGEPDMFYTQVNGRPMIANFEQLIKYFCT